MSALVCSVTGWHGGDSGKSLRRCGFQVQADSSRSCEAEENPEGAAGPWRHGVQRHRHPERKDRRSQLGFHRRQVPRASRCFLSAFSVCVCVSVLPFSFWLSGRGWSLKRRCSCVGNKSVCQSDHWNQKVSRWNPANAAPYSLSPEVTAARSNVVRLSTDTHKQTHVCFCVFLCVCARACVCGIAHHMLTAPDSLLI